MEAPPSPPSSPLRLVPTSKRDKYTQLRARFTMASNVRNKHPLDDGVMFNGKVGEQRRVGPDQVEIGDGRDRHVLSRL
jgi:hypothetical protein